jgi:hypothetical protein
MDKLIVIGNRRGASFARPTRQLKLEDRHAYSPQCRVIALIALARGANARR